MQTPKHRIDYTAQAQDIYDHALWKGYKFIKGRNLDSWLSYGWAMLFQRSITDFDITQLKSFLKKKNEVDIKFKSGCKLSHNERSFRTNYIGADGYVYINKMMQNAPDKNPEETLRINKLLSEAKENRLARYEEYEMKALKEMAHKQYIDNTYVVKGTKIFKR